MDFTQEKGVLRISNEADRLTVASILFKNGYTIEPIRFKKNGKAYEYCISYKKIIPDTGKVITNES